MNADRWLGLFFVIFAALLAFVWVPFDSESGIAEVVRRRLRVGDALGPTVAAGVLALGGFLTFARPTGHGGLGRSSLLWAALLLAIFAVALGTMRYAGPAVALVLAEDGYRPLRATAPWKYIGFLSGGTLLVLCVHAAVTRRVTLAAVLVALIATLVIGLLYDLPFEDLLLPPNGDI